MIHFKAADLTTKQIYKFLTGSIIPRPIAWLTTHNKKNGVVNAAPFSYFNVVAKEVALVSVSINRKNGQLKDSARNLLDNGQTVIHLVNDAVLENMNQTAASLESEQSELDNLELELTDSRAVQVPAIADAQIRMEAVVHQYLPIKDHEDEIISDLFILEILEFHFAEAVFDEKNQYILPEAFQPVSRLAGNFYGHLSDIIEIERPQ
ncbi:flavin reductase family protein [Enterococcus sp. LJL90]